MLKITKLSMTRNSNSIHNQFQNKSPDKRNISRPFKRDMPRHSNELKRVGGLFTRLVFSCERYNFLWLKIAKTLNLTFSYVNKTQIISMECAETRFKASVWLRTDR